MAISLDVFLPDMLGWAVLSQLKQDPQTRHIPVQIVTLDEDRQHGLAGGAFAFVNKPTTIDGLKKSIARLTDYARTPRKRLLVVEDNPAELLGITELLGHDDIEVVTAENGARRAGDHARAPGRLRRSRPQAARHVRIRAARAHSSRTTTLAQVPVVVFTGRELSPEEDAQLHTMARSVVVKGVELPERLLDETALFLHRVVSRPAAGQAAHAGATAQLRRKPARPQGAPRRRRCAQHLRVEQRARASRDGRAHRDDGPRGDRDSQGRPRHFDRPHGHHDAGDGRLRNDAGHPIRSRRCGAFRSLPSPPKR